MNTLVHPVVVTVLLLGTAAFAQQLPAESSSTARKNEQSGQISDSQIVDQKRVDETHDSATAKNMDKMATTVTRMAELCEQMMAKEMSSMPFKIAAGIGLAVLVSIVLLMLVILEVQWIFYWCCLLKEQRRLS